MSNRNLSRPQFTLIQGGKSEPECQCGEPDVYDGYAECPADHHDWQD